MATNPREVIEELRAERLKQRAELRKAKIDARTKLEEAVAKARAKAAQAKEEAQAESAEGGAGEVSGGQMPFTNVNPQKPTSNVSQTSFDRLDEELVGETPQGAARGGSAAQEILSRSGRSPVAGGRLQESQARDARPTAPPLLTSQQTDTTERTRRLGPAGVAFPSRTTRTSTSVEPNVLSARDAMLGRIRQRENAREQLQETVEAEAKALGGLMFRAQNGDSDDEAALRAKVKAVRQQFGSEAASLILQRAQNERTRLNVQERQDRLQSRRTEGRQRRAEGRRQGRPTAEADRREAEIMLKILENGRDSLTPNESTFLEERRQSDPIKSMIRDALGGSSRAGVVRTPSQQDIAEAERKLREETGKPPEPWQVRQHLESKGFVIE